MPDSFPTARAEPKLLRIEATVNGRKVAKSVQPFARLLDFVRDDLNLTGTKEGCGAGECGTCSVFVDGVLVPIMDRPSTGAEYLASKIA